MPVFASADAEYTTIRHPIWDDDEHVVLRRVSYGMEKRAQSKAVKLPAGLGATQLRAMSEQDVERLLMENTDAAAVDLSLLEQGIVSWTLRRAPTAAQALGGERGDVMPLSAASIAQLPPSAGEYIRAELDKLRDVVDAVQALGPKGDDFRTPMSDAGSGSV